MTSMVETHLVSVITAGIVCLTATGFVKIYQELQKPKPYGNSVIASKSINSKRGGIHQTAVLMPTNMTSDQADVLQMAYDIAKSDGHVSPEKLQALLIQESKLCTMKNYKVAGQELGNGTNNLYYGCGQIKYAAALDVLANYPELKKFLQSNTRDEIVANLILNKEFNIRIASKYLMMMGGTTNSGITAYNQGKTGATKVDINNWHYTVAINNYAVKLNQRKQTK